MTIVIAEDQQLIREAFAQACSEVGIHVLGAVEDGRKAVAAILTHQPETVLLDLGLSVLNGLGVVKAIRAAGYHPRFLLASGYCDEYTVYRVDKLQVHGFLDKRATSSDALKAALRAVENGAPFFSRSYQNIRDRIRSDSTSFAKVLSDREIEVVTYVADGLDDHEISGRLDISSATAKKHRFNVMRKLSLTSRAQFRRYVEVHGLTQGFRVTVS